MSWNGPFKPRATSCQAQQEAPGVITLQGSQHQEVYKPMLPGRGHTAPVGGTDSKVILQCISLRGTCLLSSLQAVHVGVWATSPEEGADVDTIKCNDDRCPQELRQSLSEVQGRRAGGCCKPRCMWPSWQRFKKRKGVRSLECRQITPAVGRGVGVTSL